MQSFDTLASFTAALGALPAVKHVYPASANGENGRFAAMVRTDTARMLAATESCGFQGESAGNGLLLCPLTAENAAVLMRLFPYTAPTSHRDHALTIGLGDRLGLASPGHIRIAKAYGAFPVLAQQSTRELALTGRTFEEVLAAAAFAVFQEGYRDGYGADGDHLKNAEEIRYALSCGYTMITLDCSEHIDANVANLSPAEIDAAYASVDAKTKAHYEERYLGKQFPVIGEIGENALRGIVLMFAKAIDHTERCYGLIKAESAKPFDFEVSIDETRSSTDPAAHFVIANELILSGVEIRSMAPHFCGEFEKGIDYIGNVTDFEREFKAHEEIAEHFGYKLSVHSGSDKFSVFPIVGRLTGCRVHVKTAGTNWLEALRVLAEEDPALYRRAHKFALAHQAEAKKYYHITSDTSDVPDIDLESDAYLPEYLNRVSSRQAMHIAYGLLLREEWFHDGLFALLFRREDAYADALYRHIGKHLRLLTGRTL